MNNLPKMNSIFVLILCLSLVRHSEASREMHSFESSYEMAEVAGYGMEKLSTVLVTGSVVCDACMTGNVATHPKPISGAVVRVTCQTDQKRKVISAQGIADKYGDFIIDLPSELHANPYLDQTCVAKVQKVPKKSLCHATFLRKHKAIKLSSVGSGIREYTAGKIRLHNLKHTEAHACAKNASNGEQI